MFFQWNISIINYILLPKQIDGFPPEGLDAFNKINHYSNIWNVYNSRLNYYYG